MEITGVVASLLRSMECLSLLILGLSLSAYSGKITEYVMPSETCGYIVDRGDQFKLSSVRDPAPDITTSDQAVATYVPSYPDSVDCEISFRTTPDKRFFMRITHFQLELSTQCQNDALLLYDGASSNEGQLVNNINPNGLCGLTLSLPNYFYSKGNDVTVRFKTNERNNSYSGFVMLLTPYWLPADGANCTEDEMTCKLSGKCFTKDAYCNSVNQCEDSSDEPGLTACKSSSSRLCGNHMMGLILALFITYIFTAANHVIYTPRHPTF